MEDHVKVRLKYVELVRARKLDEAQIVLESIWDRKPKHSNICTQEEIINPVVVESVKKEIISNNDYPNLSDLTKIKGIGKKTIKDIMVMFDDVDGLKLALKNNRVALRDDIVNLLKSTLL